jgi:hypothetical protein
MRALSAAMLCLFGLSTAWAQADGPVEVPPPEAEIRKAAEAQIQEALRQTGLGNATVSGVKVQTSWSWEAIAQRGVKIETAEQATRVLEAGLAEWETQARQGNQAKLQTVTEALHELRWAVDDYRWKFEWVELTWETRLDALRDRMQLGREGKVAEQLQRLRWVSNELPAWILDKVVEQSSRRVFERAGPKAGSAFAKVHPGLVPNAVYYPEGEMFGETKPNELTFGQRFVNQVYEASRKVPRAQRALFQQQVFGFMAARLAVHLNGGVGDADRLVREATNAEILPEAKRMGTKAKLEIDRVGTIARDGRRTIPENPVERAKREAWERRVNNAIAELDRARLGNGRLDWSKVRTVGQEFTSGFGKFLLAIFLKELATGLAENDPARVKELYTEMGVLGLFKEYGLFMAGAAAGDVLYKRLLEKQMAARAPVLGRVVRSNLALATGLALPRLVRGEGLDRTYAVSLASLGLSAVAIDGVMGLIPGVKRLRAARALTGASRALRFGGWFYQGAELALVLTVGETIEHWWLDTLQRGDLLDALEGSAATLVECDDADFDAALHDSMNRWDDWRAYLLKPALEAQAKFHEGLGRAARLAKLDEDQATKARQLAEKFPGLPLEDFAGQVGTSERSARDFTALGRNYEQDVSQALGEAYHGARRDHALLDGVSSAKAFAGAHQDASQNRLQTYEDQRDALDYVASVRGDSEALQQARRLLEAQWQLDEGLLGDGAVLGEASGAADALRDAAGGE